MMQCDLQLKKQAWPWLGLAISLAVLAGCQESGPNRISVSGEVLWKGDSLQSGLITFIPVDSGTAASGEIHDGKFEIARQVGPSPGPCRVEILSYQKTGRMIAGMAPGTQEAEIKQVIPAKYNTRTELKDDLMADKPIRIELSAP